MEEKINYYTFDNKKICGIINIVNQNQEIAIICHARTSSKDSRPTTMLANCLTKEKINNFRFDFTSCGESDGDYNDYDNDYYLSAIINNYFEGYYKSCKIFKYLVDNECELKDIHMIILEECENEKERTQLEIEYIKTIWGK